jgi:hypothetical protein
VALEVEVGDEGLELLRPFSLSFLADNGRRRSTMRSPRCMGRPMFESASDRTTSPLATATPSNLAAAATVHTISDDELSSLGGVASVDDDGVLPDVGAHVLRGALGELCGSEVRVG